MARKCEKGLSCGLSCITRLKTCNGKIGNNGNGLLDGATGLILSNSQKASVELLGEGNFGIVKLTENGTARKESKWDYINDQEVKIADWAGAMGIGPRVVSVSRDPDSQQISGYEMEYLKGYETLRKKSPNSGLGILIKKGDALASSVIENLAKIHRQGISHNDLSSANVMISLDGKKSKFIDFGMSEINSKSGSIVYELQRSLGSANANNFEPGSKASKLYVLMKDIANSSANLDQNNANFSTEMTRLQKAYSKGLKEIMG